MSIKNIKNILSYLYKKFEESEEYKKYFEECKEYFKKLNDNNNKYNNIFYNREFMENIKNKLLDEESLEMSQDGSFKINESSTSEKCHKISKFLEKRIYRIESFVRVKKLLQNEELVLVRPSKWDDPYENFFLKEEVTIGSECYSLQNIEKDWYGQCWTLEEESDALWRIYSPHKDGVRITTTIGRLFDAIYDIKKFPSAQLQFFIGQVEYKKLKDIQKIIKNTPFKRVEDKGDNKGFAKLLMIKRDIFSYEKEVRILASKSDKKDINENIDECNGLWKFPVNIRELLLDNLYLDPRLDENKFNECREVLEKIKNEKNLCFKVEQSKLYKFEGKPTISYQ